MPDDWTPRLADAIAGAVREFSPRLDGAAVTLLALDCHPWNGTIGLSVLTAAEAAADEELADPAEMAAWRHYDFAHDLAAWRPAADLAGAMRAAYEAGGRPAAADAFLRACAAALTSVPVGAALGRLQRADGFRVSVAHPDDGREFAASGHNLADEASSLKAVAGG